MKQAIKTETHGNGLTYLSEEQGATMLDRPLPWQVAGLTWTASGYGARIPSSRVIRFADGRERRIYVTQYSNAGTAWIVLNGRHVIVRDYYR